MTIRFVKAILAASILACGSALAQVGGTSSPSPLGVTSPLSIGPTSAVPRTGIPLGAMELPSPGVSPSATPCSGVADPMSQGSPGGASAGTPSSATSMFDGGGTAGTASGVCATIGSDPSAASPGIGAPSPGMGPASSGGRIGIPLGSTELGAQGLAPPPDISTITTPSFVSPSPAPMSAPGNTVPCPTSATSMSVSTSC